MSPDVVLGLVGVVGILAGLIGTVVPVVPGLVVVWLATAGTLLAQGRSPMVWVVVVVLSGLMVSGSVASTVLPARRAAAGGAPGRSLSMAAAGAIVGFFVIPVLGLLVGGVAGLMLAERDRLGEWGPAWTSAKGVLAAYGWGVLLEIVVGVLMGLVWLATFVLRAV